MIEKPDPAFMAFFANDWKALHESVVVPGLPHASWDRKAAYLVYQLRQGKHTSPPVQTKPAIQPTVHVRSRTAPPLPPAAPARTRERAR